MSKGIKGKIAVIPGCTHCPHKAYDSTMGMIQQEDGSWIHQSSEVCFCGYWLGTTEAYGTGENYYHIRLEVFLPPPGGDYNIIMNHPDFGKPMPDNCPLPYGEE